MDFWLDTNVIIRFLANDHVEHSAAAKQVIMEAYQGKYGLWIHSVVLAECCYVLEGKHYGYDRKTISEVLSSLLNTKGIRPESPRLLQALEVYGQHSVDFEDALLAVLSHNHPFPVLTFNGKDYHKAGCEYYDPLSLV